MWAPPPPKPEPPGWWTKLSFDRWVAGVAADLRDKERDKEQAKRLRRLRRRVEKLNETLCLAEGASDARRHLRQQGTYERSTHGYPGPDHGVEARRAGEVEHGPPGRVLRVR
jgi:hypothetical protein